MKDNDDIDNDYDIINPSLKIKESKFQKSKKLSHLTTNENCKPFKFSVELDRNKKGVLSIVSETIRSTFVNKFNNKPKETNSKLTSFITSRLLSQTKTNREDLKKSIKIVGSSSHKLEERNYLPNLPVQVIISRKESYIARNISSSHSINNCLPNNKLYDKIRPESEKVFNEKTSNNHSIDRKLKSFLKHNLPLKINLFKKRPIVQSAKPNQFKNGKDAFQKFGTFSSNINFDGALNKPIYTNAAVGTTDNYFSTDIVQNLSFPNMKLSIQKRNLRNKLENNEKNNSSNTDLEKLSYLFKIINNNEKDTKKIKSHSFAHNINNYSDMSLLEFKISKKKEIDQKHFIKLKQNLTTTYCQNPKIQDISMKNENLRLLLKNKTRTDSHKKDENNIKNNSISKENSKIHQFLSKLVENGSTDKTIIKVLDRLNKENIPIKKQKIESNLKSKSKAEKNIDRFKMLKVEVSQYRENKKNILHSLSKFQRDSDEYIQNFRKILKIDKRNKKKKIN